MLPKFRAYVQAGCACLSISNTGGTVFAIAIPYANSEVEYTEITGGAWRLFR